MLIPRELDFSRSTALASLRSSAAPGAQVYCRLLVEDKGAEWPLTRKFGCVPEMAADLLLRARALGMRAVGVSFHVGSQQTEPRRWATAIGNAATVFQACAQAGLDLELLNVGGGSPPAAAIECPLDRSQHLKCPHGHYMRPGCRRTCKLP